MTSNDFWATVCEKLVEMPEINDLYVCIPHQLPPRIKSSVFEPPEEGDRYVLGDHDMRETIPLYAALSYRGHRDVAVHSLAIGRIAEELPSNWLERLACEQFQGTRISDQEFRRVLSLLPWIQVYPEVDGDLCLTGRIVDCDAEGYVNVDDDALMPEELAKDWRVVEGYIKERIWQSSMTGRTTP